MARKPPAPSPPAIAIERLNRFAQSGVIPKRAERAALDAVAEWRATADSDISRRWTAILYADILVGLAAAEEHAVDMDTSEPGAERHARAVVDALRIMRDALEGELAEM